MVGVSCRLSCGMRRSTKLRYASESMPPDDVRAEDSILRTPVFALEEQGLVYQASDVVSHYESASYGVAYRSTTGILTKWRPDESPRFR
jgi:hypothetical protein